MIKALRLIPLLVLALYCASAHAIGLDGHFFLGFNQPYLNDQYGTDLTSSFNADHFENTYAAIHNAGGTVVRLFLFPARQGIRISNSLPRGISATMLINLGVVMQIARRHKLKLYLTPLLGEEPTKVTGEWRTFYDNIYASPAGNDLFNQTVMIPVLDLLNKNRDVVFAMDMMNEIDSTVRKGFWPGEQLGGARRWVARNASFMKRRSPWLKLTVSVGWAGAQNLLIGGFLSGLGLDFYDLHVYADDGTFSGATALCARVRAERMPIVLGEFGQKSPIVNDALQLAVAQRFVATAYGTCFSGALSWAFDSKLTPWWSVTRSDGSERPIASLFRSFPQR